MQDLLHPWSCSYFCLKLHCVVRVVQSFVSLGLRPWIISWKNLKRHAPCAAAPSLPEWRHAVWFKVVWSQNCIIRGLSFFYHAQLIYNERARRLCNAALRTSNRVVTPHHSPARFIQPSTRMVPGKQTVLNAVSSLESALLDRKKLGQWASHPELQLDIAIRPCLYLF